MGTGQLRQTHTFVRLELSKAAYDEIRTKLLAAKYEHAFQNIGKHDELIDMIGIAVTKPCEHQNRKEVANEQFYVEYRCLDCQEVFKVND